MSDWPNVNMVPRGFWARGWCQGSSDLLLGWEWGVPFLLLSFGAFPQVYHARLWQYVQLLHRSFHSRPGEESACGFHSRGSEEAFWAGEKFCRLSSYKCVFRRMRTAFLVSLPVLSLSCRSLEPYLARNTWLNIFDLLPMWSLLRRQHSGMERAWVYNQMAECEFYLPHSLVWCPAAGHLTIFFW